MDGIVIIGASQGGVLALRQLVAKLPPRFPAPVIAVVHVGSGPSVLPSILNDLGGLPASHARQGATLEAGHIYIAPPDRHVLVVDGNLELTHGPRENWARPAVDPLFRSAAEAYGPGAIGIVLTGRLNDGSAGLYEIKRRGGIAIVQEPSEAEAPSMPESVLLNVDVDYRLPISEMAGVLLQLLKDMAAKPSYKKNAGDQKMAEITTPTAQTCPECGGAMAKEQLGKMTRFRCHIGHVMSAEVLAATQLEKLAADLAAAQRSLNERAALARSLAAKQEAQGNTETAAQWQAAGTQAEKLEEAIRQMVKTDWIHPEEREP